MNNKEITKIKFKKRIDEGKSIRYNDLKVDDKTLLYSVKRYFGSIVKLCEDIGISKQELIDNYGFTRNIDKKTLSENEIKERLLYLKSIGKLTTNAMRKEFDDLRLEQSLKKVYGSVNDGLTYFGLERDTKIVTKESLLKKIYEYQENGIDLCYSNMITQDSVLVNNSISKFKSGWNKLLTDLEIDFIPKRIPYSKESISERLHSISKEYGVLNYGLISEIDSSILYCADTNYDRLEDFYIDMGYNPKECMDFDTQKSRGRRFELVFREILRALNINHTHNKYLNNGSIRPDFQLEGNIWIDTKLSSWTESTKKTVKKYNPYCDKLIIVYLRGNKRKLYEYSQYNVEFRKIDYYYPLLENINRQDLIFKCQDVLK